MSKDETVGPAHYSQDRRGNGASWWGRMDDSGWGLERLPERQNRDLCRRPTTFRRTPESVSVGEKGAVKGLEPKFGHLLCDQRKE